MYNVSSQGLKKGNFKKPPTLSLPKRAPTAPPIVVQKPNRRRDISYFNSNKNVNKTTLFPVSLSQKEIGVPRSKQVNTTVSLP
jgi:hypothetical protein